MGATASSLQIPFEKVSAMIATVSAITRQSATTVGTAINSILSRVESVRKVGFDATDGTSINQVSEALSKAGVQLMDSNKQFRNFSDVLDDLSKKWGSLDTVTQRYVATTVAGTRQQTQFLSIMDNYQQVLDLTNQAASAAGTTQSKYNIYLQGTQAHIDSLKNSLQGLWSDSFKSNGINTIVDTLTSLVSGVGSVVHTFGLLPSVVFLASTALLMFNKNLQLIAEGGWKSAFASLSGGFSSAAASAFALNLKLIATRLSAIALQATMSLGLSLAISAVVEGITSLIQHNEKLAEQQKVLDAQNKTITTSWNAQKDTITSLVAEYDKLDGIKNRSVDQDKRYLEITDQLSKLMPNLVKSIDEKGQAHLLTGDAIKRELGYAEQLAKLEKEKELVTSKKDFADIQSQKDALQKQLKLVNNQISTKNKFGVDDGLLTHQLSADEVASLRIQALGLESQIASTTDNLKEKITSLTGTILELSGIKVGDSVSTELNKILKSVDTSTLKNFDPAVFTSKIASAIKQFNFAGNQGQFESAKKSFDDLFASIGKTDKEAQAFMDTIVGVSSTQQKSIQQTTDYAKSISDLDKEIETADKSVSTLASTYQKLQSGEQLSVDETLKLVEAHPQLLDYLSQHNGLITDKGVILQQVANIERQTRLDEAKGLLDSVTDTRNALEAKREMYKQFYTALNPIFADQFTHAGQTPTFGGTNYKDALSPQEQKSLDDSAQQQKELKLRVDLLSKPIDLKTYGTKPTTSATPDTTSSETKRDMDVFSREQKAQDDLLVVSDAHLAKYKDTTKAYRDELASQIPIYKEKQKLAHEEKLSLDDVNAGIQKRLDTEKLTKSQQNTLYNDMDANNNKIAALQKSWLDYDKTISDISNKNSLSLVSEAIEKTSANTKVFDDKVKSLKTSMDSLKTDPAEKLKDQNELLKTYSQEQDALIDANTKLEALSATLDKNSDAYAKNADEITKNKASLQQITADVDSERMKVATEAIDVIKKGIQTEIDAEKKLHDVIVKNYDDEQKKFDDATQAKSDAIDKVNNAGIYTEGLTKDQTDLQNIQNQINVGKLDTSNDGKARVVDLEKQKADLVTKINDEMNKHSIDVQKQDLQDKQKLYDKDVANKKTAEDAKSQAVTDALTNQLNDDTKWTNLERDLINGHVQGIQTEMTNLITGLGTYAQNSLIAVGEQATKIKAIISQVASSSNQVGNLPPINSNPASNGTTTTWQENLARATTDDAYAASEIKRAQDVYNADKAKGDMAGANAAHKWADQIRAANPRVASMDTGGYTGDFAGGKLALLHQKELVLNKLDTSNILKVVDFTRDIMSKIKTPDFSKLVPKMSSNGGNVFNANFGAINITGDKAGGETAINTIVNGLKRLGVNINQ